MEVNDRVQFVLVGLQKGVSSDGFWAAFRFNPRVAVKPEEMPSFLANPDNLVYVRRDSLAKFSPDSLSVMEFQTRRDFDITEKAYRTAPYLGQTTDGWNLRAGIEIHATNNRAIINNKQLGLPLFEGGTIHQFDAFYNGYEFWVNESGGRKRLLGVRNTDDGQIMAYQRPRVAYREIARASDERSLIAAFVPANVFCNHKLFVLQTGSTATDLYLLGILNSLVVDYLVRFKIATSVSLYILKQLPVPRLTKGNAYFDAIVPRAARLTCTRAEFAGLWESVMGEAWDESKGATDPAARQTLRDEIDALAAHLYGLTRAEFDHILGTFPLVFPDNEAGRAKRAALLATYERMGL